ncbi:helix-turn-helix domain-containing protein [Streptomyces sp. NPDC046821]|uniref:helix-turn-helix domain-containing protein n=1 Tax=Streptomyces sp. NPDC046821 TaxID=3154702 RepID=UPI0033C7E60B
MEGLPFDQWALAWAVSARKVSQGAVVAGLLVDLAADPRRIHGSPTVAFPLSPAARALGVTPVIVSTALHRLADAGLLRFRTEDMPDPLLVAVTLLPPASALDREPMSSPSTNGLQGDTTVLDRSAPPCPPSSQ